MFAIRTEFGAPLPKEDKMWTGLNMGLFLLGVIGGILVAVAVIISFAIVDSTKVRRELKELERGRML